MATTTWDNPFGAEDTDSPLDFDLESYPVVPPRSEERAFSSLPALAEPWPSGLVFDLALGIDSTQTILDRYAISPEDYEQFMAIPAFRRELAETMRKNQEEGISFSRKMANIAEECIPTIYNIIKDPLVPASTRGDLWKHTAKLGKLEPTTKENTMQQAVQVQIQINL